MKDAIAIALLAIWMVTPPICVWLLFKVNKLSKEVSDLRNTVQSIDDDMDELWDAVFPDDDPDDEVDADDLPTNVIAFGPKRAA